MQEGNAIPNMADMDEYNEYVNTCKGMRYGLLLSLPIWAIMIFMVIKT